MSPPKTCVAAFGWVGRHGNSSEIWLLDAPCLSGHANNIVEHSQLNMRYDGRSSRFGTAGRETQRECSTSGEKRASYVKSWQEAIIRRSDICQCLRCDHERSSNFKFGESANSSSEMKHFHFSADDKSKYPTQSGVFETQDDLCTVLDYLVPAIQVHFEHKRRTCSVHRRDLTRLPGSGKHINDNQPTN